MLQWQRSININANSLYASQCFLVLLWACADSFHFLMEIATVKHNVVLMLKIGGID